MEKEIKVSGAVVDPNRPKKKTDDWYPNSCPLFIFGDDDAAEYDMAKMKKFFSRFKKKKE